MAYETTPTSRWPTLLLAAAGLTLLACAPPSTMPPPVPMAKGTHMEVGAATSVGYGFRPILEEGSTTSATADVQIWGLFGVTKRFQVGVTGFAGNSSAAGLGVLARYQLLRAPGSAVYFQADGGLGWARVGFPWSRRLRKDRWFTSSPMIQVWDVWSADTLMYLPIGMTYQMGPWGWFHWELSYRMSFNDPQRYNVFVTLGYSMRDRGRGRRAPDRERPPR